MFDPQMELLLTVLVSVVRYPVPGAPPTDDGEAQASWSDAQAAMRACENVDEDVELAVSLEDADELRAILDAWFGGQRHLLEHDRAVLKRAMKAYRKRLKVTLLDDESTLGGSAMSGGRSSGIVGITPPERYPRAVWDELVRQGRLVGGGMGTYELPPE